MKNRIANYFWSTDYPEVNKTTHEPVEWKTMNNPFIADEGYFKTEKKKADNKSKLELSKPRLILGIYIITCTLYCTYSIFSYLLSLIFS